MTKLQSFKNIFSLGKPRLGAKLWKAKNKKLSAIGRAPIFWDLWLKTWKKNNKLQTKKKRSKTWKKGKKEKETKNMEQEPKQETKSKSRKKKNE